MGKLVGEIMIDFASIRKYPIVKGTERSVYKALCLNIG